MTIWLLAIILLACLAAIGYQQGAIRVGISFFGIILAAMLAGPLAKLVKPAVAALGVVNPVLLWVIPPFVVFIVVLSLVKVGALARHKKVDVHYKYKAGDLRLALWERLNARLGACLGGLNALVYLVLISWVAYAFSYWTVQMASGVDDPKLVRFLNQVGHDVQSTGMTRAVRAIDPLPDVFYEAADLTGLLYQNPLAEARLSRYPAFLMVAERPDFQALAQNQGFSTLRLQRKPVREVLDNPNVAGIVKDPEKLKFVWNLVTPDLQDLTKFLKEGTSDKYTDKILGRWYFDLNAAMVAYRKLKPNVAATEMLKVRRMITGLYSKTMMIAAPDHMLLVKTLPQVKPQAAGTPPSTETQNVQGQWKSVGSDYELSLGILGERTAKFEAGGLA